MQRKILVKNVSGIGSRMKMLHYYYIATGKIINGESLVSQLVFETVT